MFATYVSVLAVCAASLAIGQAVVSLCGWRSWSWLSPAVGLAALCAICWGTVRLPGGGATSGVVVLVLSAAAIVFLRRRGDVRGVARVGAPVALAALVAASLPFIAEGHFGILGTSFNPDMSQHLLAASRLSDGADSPLLAQGYPLGPHSVVVALHDSLGVGLVQGFGGLTVAVSILAALTAISAFADLPPIRRIVACLLVGVPYMVASYFAQGAFKETIEALFLLGFIFGLREIRSAGPSVARAAPLAVIAAGSVYAYSFPGLVWLGAAGIFWAGLELMRAPRPRGAVLRAAAPPLALAVLVGAVLVAPEIGRILDFRNFETFDPNGAGLGNLFGQISPFEGLGIWPSGDFRLTPGDGAVPAVGYHLGAAFALMLLGNGLVWCLRRRETAVPAGVAAAVAIYAYARITGTPYQAAKAIELIAPVAALAIVLPLAEVRFRPLPRSVRGAVPALAAAFFAVAAVGCTLLALANAPVGPTSYSPHLTELRPLTAGKPTLVLAPHELLADQHGGPYISWELRGGHICIAPAGSLDRPPQGVGLVVSAGGEGPPFSGLSRIRSSGPYTLWAVRRPRPGRSPCPLIAVRSARQGTAPG